VTQVLNAVAGVAVSEVRLGAARFTSDLDPAPVEAALTAVNKAGFTAQLES